ncbi:hypothetical protein B7463_g10803, partial [Scytalidium lignicola]
METSQSEGFISLFNDDSVGNASNLPVSELATVAYNDIQSRAFISAPFASGYLNVSPTAGPVLDNGNLSTTLIGTDYPLPAPNGTIHSTADGSQLYLPTIPLTTGIYNFPSHLNHPPNDLLPQDPSILEPHYRHIAEYGAYPIGDGDQHPFRITPYITGACDLPFSPNALTDSSAQAIPFSVNDDLSNTGDSDWSTIFDNFLEQIRLPVPLETILLPPPPTAAAEAIVLRVAIQIVVLLAAVQVISSVTGKSMLRPSILVLSALMYSRNTKSLFRAWNIEKVYSKKDKLIKNG